MHKDSISYIVESTVDAMEIDNSTAFKMLIKMTFLMETQFQSVLNKPKSHLGFMAMERSELGRLIKQYIIPRPSVREKIENVSLVDLKKDSMDDIIEACIYNVAFQVAITWAAYISRYDHAPSVDHQSVAEKYLNFWKADFTSDQKLMECVTRYRTVFNTRN